MNIRNRVKALRTVKASELAPNPKNWRTHPEAQQDALRGILAEVGYADALLARELPDGSLMLVDGHLRAETTPDQEVPVLILDINEAEADKLLLSLDPLAALAETNAVALDSLLREVDTGSEGLQQMYADMAEAAELYERDNAEIVEDEIPEPPVDPITKPGDLWILGDHRLLCGDSTKAEDVERLMAGAKADLCFTSPPYGAANVAKLRDHYVPGAAKRESFYDQHEDDPDSWPDLMAGWFAAFRPVSECVICNVQMLADNKRAMVRWLAERSNDLVDVIVWDKVNAAPQMQANVLSNAFEFCFVFGGNASRAIPFADFHGTLSNVLRLDPRGKNDQADKHRAVFPLELPAWFMQSLCREAKTVADPFCGTGTTLIAAEQLGRKCYGMEISPQYCDVIVKRWETLTGKKAELEASNGQARPTQRADDHQDRQGQPRQKAAEQKRTKAAKR
jgi:DNA modification methylase